MEVLILHLQKIGYSQTLEGQKVSGTMTGRSELVTGNEAGSNKGLTGDQYLGADPLPSGRPAEKGWLTNNNSWEWCNWYRCL